MATLHEVILENGKPAFERMYGDSITDIQFYKAVFKNFRHKNGEPHGLRLTGVGNNLLKRIYDAHTYAVEGEINHLVFVQMDLHMSWPYYVGRKNATFYNTDDAAWFRLNNNDLKLYTEHL